MLWQNCFVPANCIAPSVIQLQLPAKLRVHNSLLPTLPQDIQSKRGHRTLDMFVSHWISLALQYILTRRCHLCRPVSRKFIPFVQHLRHGEASLIPNDSSLRTVNVHNRRQTSSSAQVSKRESRPPTLAAIQSFFSESNSTACVAIKDP